MKSSILKDELCRGEENIPQAIERKDHEKALRLWQSQYYVTPDFDFKNQTLHAIEVLRRQAGRPSLFPKDISGALRSAHAPRIEYFSGLHSGSRLFILGNGPSLNKVDLSLLKNEFTMGVNNIFYIFDRIDFIPTYYLVGDRLVAEDSASAINSLTGNFKFFKNTLHGVLDEKDDVIWLKVVMDYFPYRDFPHFSVDIAERIWAGGTITYTCLQLAFYIGFNPVYLVGMDHTFQVPADAKSHGSTYISSSANDPNHFHPNYFGKGKRWYNPRPERMELAYHKAKFVYKLNGRNIFNATPGGETRDFSKGTL